MMANENADAALPPAEGESVVPSLTATAEPTKKHRFSNLIKRIFSKGNNAEVPQAGSAMAQPLENQPMSVDSGTPIPVSQGDFSGGPMEVVGQDAPEAVASAVEAQLGKATGEINNPVSSFIPIVGPTPVDTKTSKIPPVSPDPEPKPAA